MDEGIIQVLVLGFVQGLAEFLPISSSGHLVLVQSILPSFNQPGILLDTFLHLGTVFSVILFFNKRIIELLKKYFLFIIVGSIPAGIVGILFNDYIEGLFNSVKIVGIALIVTGLINYLTAKLPDNKNPITVKKSLFIGLWQAFAIIPGISRSGSTIFAGSFIKLEKKTAAEFSFLLSLPAILGANLVQFFKYSGEVNFVFSHYLIGFSVSAMTGYFAIKLVLDFISKGKFVYFSIYCFLIGLIAVFV